MNQRRLVGIAALVLAVAALVWIQWPEPSEELARKGGAVVADPGGIFRPGLADASQLRTQELDSVEVADDDRTISVRFVGGNPGCWSLDQVRVGYEPERVLLGLYGGVHTLPEGTACTAEGRTYSLKISLDRPVSVRPVEAAVPVVRGGFVADDRDGIFRPGRVLYGQIRAVEVQSTRVSAGDDTVTVRFLGGNSSCWSVDQVSFKFEPRRIVLGVYGGYHPPPQVFCTSEGLTYDLAFRLDQRVRGRPIEAVERLSEPR